MNFTCAACHTSYDIEDGRVRGRVVRARCRTCGMAIDVAKLQQRTAAARTRRYEPQPQPAYGAQPSYAAQHANDQPSYDHPAYDHYDHDPREHGAYEESSYDDRYAQPQGAYGTLPQFGSGSVAASDSFEHDEPPTHAFESPVLRQGDGAARRTDARPKRDLFAPAPPEDVPAVREIAAPASRAVGERSENSVLFTLAALEPPKRRAEQTKQAERAAESVDDHSGMIDLFALARAAKASRQASAPVFPTDPPFGAFTTELAPPLARPRMSKRTRLIAAGAVSAMVTGLAAFFLSSSDAPPRDFSPRPAIAAAAPAPVSAPPPSVTAAVAAVDTKTVATPAGAKVASPAARGKAKGAKPAHRASVPAVAKTRSTPPPAASDPCHCKGNLLCSMKCSV